jgi:predicted dehydrogenase
MPRINRRFFLFGALGAPVLGRSVAHAAFAPEKLKVGIIGVGGQGGYSWNSLADEDVVMLCDVDTTRAAEAKAKFPSAEVVQDFRRVIDRQDIDAVAVCTPDHWHAIPSVWAMQSGKHVYCEKPLAHSVHECRVMAETAKERKRVTQMGTQIHAGANYRRVVELVRAGAIGPVRRVEVWCDRRADVLKRGESAPPPTLDYELWVGPAPMRPFDPNVVPFKWRWWWEFGGGVLADMACHYMDLPHWALDLRHPERVSASGVVEPEAENRMPQEMRVDFHYAASGSRPAVHLTWFHGAPGPRDETGAVRNLGMGSGVLFHGESGQLLADYNRHRLLPEEKFKDYQRPEPSIAPSPGHHKEWVNAIKNGGPTSCNFDYSGALSETVLLGNAAYHLGREIRWDPEKLEITNVRREDWRPLLRRRYRGHWKLRR